MHTGPLFPNTDNGFNVTDVGIDSVDRARTPGSRICISKEETVVLQVGWGHTWARLPSLSRALSLFFGRSSGYKNEAYSNPCLFAMIVNLPHFFSGYLSSRSIDYDDICL